MKNDEKSSKDITNAIYSKVKEEAGIVGWNNKRSSEKKMSIAIYDIYLRMDILKIKLTS